MLSILALLNSIQIWSRCVNGLDPRDMKQLGPNSPISGIWFRWQPILKLSDGSDCVSYPAINIDGELADAYINNDKHDDPAGDCPNSMGQTYSRLWLTNDGKQQGVVYTWLFPRSGRDKLERIWLTSVYWMKTDGEVLLGCSFYGMYRDRLPDGQLLHGWQHFDAEVCRLEQDVDDWGTLRNVVSKWYSYLQPGSAGRHALKGMPTLLVFDYMPEHLKQILANAEFDYDYDKFPLGNHGWYGMPALYKLFREFLHT